MAIRRSSRLVILTCILLSTLGIDLPAPAQVPHRVALQGTVQVNGQPYTGNGRFKFALVDAAGTTTYWSQDGSSSGASEPNSSVALPVVDGGYTAILGDTQLANMGELPPSVFANSNVHARVWFSDGAHPFQHLAPDEALLPAAYAMMSAQVAAGAVGSTQLADGAVTASKLAAGSVTPAALADGAVVANLGKSGGLIVSTSPTNSALLEAGYRKIASTTVEGESWQSLDRISPPPRAGHRAFWTGSEMVIAGGNPVTATPDVASNMLPGFRYDPRRATWASLPTNNAPRMPRSGSVPNDAYDWRVDWTGTEILALNLRTMTASRCEPRGTEWRPFSTATAPSRRTSATTVMTSQGWFVWGGWSAVGDSAPLQDGAIYHSDRDTWTPIPTNGAPKARSGSVALWTGSQVLLFGGETVLSGGTTVSLNDVWSYDPVTESWTQLHSGVGQTLGFLGRTPALWTGKQALLFGVNSPASGMRFDPAERRWTKMASLPRTLSMPTGATAVWTGTEALLWGGYVATEPVQQGFAYDPTHDTWRELTTDEAPVPRQLHSAVWTGSEMIVWGGSDASPVNKLGSNLCDGGRYRPSDNRWIPMINPRVTRDFATAVWTGEEILVWGGNTAPSPQISSTMLGNGYRFNPKTGQTRSISTVDAPTPLPGSCAVWTGTHLLVWGGYDSVTAPRDPRRRGTGSRYDPVRDQWSSITTDGAPTTRSQASAVWTGSEMIIWGGSSSLGVVATFNDGGRYSPANNVWTPMSTTLGNQSLQPRNGHNAMWTGREMLVWGDGTNALRYLPSTDTWSSLNLKDAPSPLLDSSGSTPTAIWTDYGMLAWGSRWGFYDPNTDTWRTVPQTTAPVWTGSLSMVWTGTEVLAWNGSAAGSHRYDPIANQWTRMTPIGAPSPRTGHNLVWTGNQAVILGGYIANNRLETLTQSIPAYSRTQPLYIYSGVPKP